jgi:type IV secretion system protein TrbL
MCGPTDIKCHVLDAVQVAAGGVFDDLNQESVNAATQALNALATFWVKSTTPVTLATENGDTWTNSEPVGYLQDRVLLLTLSIFTLAILVAGMRMAWEQRAKPLQELLRAMLSFVMVCAAGTAVIQLLVEWSDQFAINIVEEATEGVSLGTALRDLVLSSDNGGDGANPLPLLMALVLAQSATIASLIQIVLMLIRSAMLVLLAGTLPIAAAATNTEVGKAWFRKFCAWTLAFVAYKPAAALIYAAAIKMNKAGMSGSGNSLVQVMAGMMMLMLAIFALPALLRLAVPVTAAVAGGGSASGSSVADPGGAATGAINVGRSAAGSFGGGSRGGGGGGGAGLGGGGGGGATGARLAGSAAGAGFGAAGAALTAARKAGGAVAGAASHSAGESGGGSITPSSFGPMARGARGGGGASRARSSGSRSSPAVGGSRSAAQERSPEPAGPTGSR